MYKKRTSNVVFTRKIERLAKQLGVKGISRSQVSKMTKGLNRQADEFRNRVLYSHHYPILWTDTLYEDVRIAGHVVSEPDKGLDSAVKFTL